VIQVVKRNIVQGMGIEALVLTTSPKHLLIQNQLELNFKKSYSLQTSKGKIPTK
jgi:hypothetical protein